MLIEVTREEPRTPASHLFLVCETLTTDSTSLQVLGYSGLSDSWSRSGSLCLSRNLSISSSGWTDWCKIVPNTLLFFHCFQDLRGCPLPRSWCSAFSHFIYIFFFLPDHCEVHQFADHFKELALVSVLFSPVWSLSLASVVYHFLLLLALSPSLTASSFSNKGTENGKFPSRCCFCCVPQMSMFLFSVSSGFLASPVISPWTWGLLRSYNNCGRPCWSVHMDPPVLDRGCSVFQLNIP